MCETINKNMARMSQQYSVITQAFVNIQITSVASTFACEKRYQKDITISILKGKLELVTGSSAVSMQLELFDKDDKFICKLDNDEAMFGSYPVEDGMRINVLDPSKKLGEFEDVSKVKKFELTDEEYATKRDSVRAFKEKNKMGRFREVDSEECKLKEEEKERLLAEEQGLCEGMKIGDRCEVSVPGQMLRFATIKFVGLADFKPGYWVGVQFDEPTGKNDGSVSGVRYFECERKYGSFIKPQYIKVGDYPEEKLSDEDEI